MRQAGCGLGVRCGCGLGVRCGCGLGVRLGGRGLLVSGTEDALGHVHYAVGALADLVEAVEEPLDPALEPRGGITARIDVPRAAVSAGRLGG